MGAKTKEHFDHYFPIEIDSKMSIEEKIPIMNEWYSKVHTCMIGEGITRSNLRACVAKCDTIRLRDGVADFIKRCQEAEPPIPVLIMSAGLGDIIEEFLRLALPFPLAPSTQVVSNRLKFDDAGVL